VDSGIHLVPLMHFQGVVGNRGREHSRCITMEGVACWKLRFVVLAIGLEEGIQVFHRGVNLLLEPVHHREVSSASNRHEFGLTGY